MHKGLMLLIASLCMNIRFVKIVGVAGLPDLLWAEQAFVLEQLFALVQMSVMVPAF